MNDTIIAAKAKEQHDNFVGKVFTHFSKPKMRFVRETTYGIQASGDTTLASIVRAIDDDVKPIQTEKRLSRNIEDEHVGDAVAQAILSEGARFVKKDTLILVDPTEIRKEYAYKMEYLTQVRDASRSSREGRDVIVNGYQGCMVAACTSGSRKTIPLALRLWSSRAPGFKGESDEVLKILDDVFDATGGNGIVVYDRGGDRPAFYGDFIEKGRDFIVRVKSRSVLSWRGLHEIRFLAENCTTRHSHHVTFDSHDRECNVPISFGTMPVKLPMFPEKQLHLVVVRGFGQQPNDAPHVPWRGRLVQVAVACRRGVSEQVAHRGDDKVRQAGVQIREQRAFSAFGLLLKKIVCHAADIDDSNTAPFLPGFAELLE